MPLVSIAITGFHYPLGSMDDMPENSMMIESNDDVSYMGGSMNDILPTITTIESVGGTANYDALMAIVEEYNSTAAILQIKSDKLLEKTDRGTFNYDSCLKDMYMSQGCVRIPYVHSRRKRY